jgi:hypothetical protein
MTSINRKKLTPHQRIGKWTLYSFLFLLASVAVLNAQPYMKASGNLFGEVVVIPGIELLAKVPLMAPVLALLGIIVPPLLGCIIWAVLQLLQCIPLFMADPEVLIRRISAAQQWCEVNLGESRVDWVNELIKRFINFPQELQEQLLKAAAISYLVDAAIGIWHYPPLKTPVQSFEQAWGYFSQLLTGKFDFSLVDWGSVGKLAVMLFAFEGIIAIALFMRQIGIYLLNLQGGSYDS